MQPTEPVNSTPRHSPTFSTSEKGETNHPLQSCLTAFIEASPEGVALVDPSGSLLYLNPAGRALLSLGAHESFDTASLWAFYPPVEAAWLERTALPAAVAQGRWSGETRLQPRTGSRRPVAQVLTAHFDGTGGLAYYATAWHDLSARKQAEARLRRQATQDPLTGLPQRRVLEARLQAALTRSEGTGRGVGVLFLDLDHFKALNDRLGHLAGDRLLQGVAQRLRSARRAPDTVVRYGGDEFVVICPGLPHPGAAEAIAARLRATVAQPLTVASQTVAVPCSIGVAYAPRDGTTGPALLAQADTHLFRVKPGPRPPAHDDRLLGGL